MAAHDPGRRRLSTGPDKRVLWHSARTGADEALRSHVAELLGPGDVAVGRLCPRCGSDGHGRPWARHTPGVGAAPTSREVHVSLSRGGGYVVTAVSLHGPLGVDVEVVADVARHWPADLVLAPGESATSDLQRARCWAAKEAVLKRRGTGLAVPMSTVLLRQERELRDLPAPDGLVAVLAGPL